MRVIDPKDLTPEEHDANTEAGAEIANMLLPALYGISPLVAYNVIGNLTSIVFAMAQYEQPHHALIEFDNWVKATREHLTSIIRERMQ